MLTFPHPHASWEQAHPADAEHAQALEISRRVQHAKAHGSLDEYTPGREFPCLGFLDVVDRGEHHWTVACSACPFETTIRSPEREPAIDDALEAAKW